MTANYVNDDANGTFQPGVSAVGLGPIRRHLLRV
jgi:hypothetical protein